MARILITTDDLEIQELLYNHLSQANFNVILFTSLADILQRVLQGGIDLIVLDLPLSESDNFELCQKIRQITKIPLIVSSVNNDVSCKIRYFEEGADDYITKPFEPMELLARIKSNLRRFDQIKALRNSAKEERDDEDVLKVGDLCLDRFRKELAVNGKSVKLTLKEYQIMELLMSYPSRIFSSEEIYEKVWQELAINTETVIVHIRRLRKKIEVDPHNPRYLKVVWGIGYKVEGGNDEKR